MATAAQAQSAPAADWFAFNQRRLIGELERLRGYLERHAAVAAGTTAAPGEATAVKLSTDQPAAALDLITAKFRLSPFERDLLLLCAGVELDSRIAALCAAANGDGSRRFVTLSLAMAALPGAHWSAITPAATLRRWRLIAVPDTGVLTTAALTIDERVLHYLAGTPHMDERLAPLVEPVPSSGALGPAHRGIAEGIVRLWSSTIAGAAAVPVVQLVGEGASDKQGIAAAASRALGLRPFVLRAAGLPTAPGELEQLSRHVEREGVLAQSVMVLECEELDESDQPRIAAVARFVERTMGAMFVTTRERRPTQQRASVAFEVPRPTAAEQRVAWTNALGEAAPRLDGAIEQLASHFNLGAHAVHSIAVEAFARGPFERDADFLDALWNGCRLHARPRIEALAQRIEASAVLDDLVLPETQKLILRDVAAQVRNRATVYERWGFGGRGARGLGISALFAGASGTGKTMAADVLGTELRLDVYRIDLSAVVSKYIGETEKNLRRIFDEAEGGGAILLFDEADALFGKRSEVKDSHDRYANIEVSYLLQRMEAYRGLAILTTNLKSALDTAFLRRIRFIVQFPFPDPAQRAEIWRRVFPSETPREDLDYERLAQLNVAGGNIKSVAMNAAFLAAEAGEPVRMGHVLRAARAEYAKLEKPLTDAEVLGWET
jgi:ATPase family associated with various cellular activities (AAA)/Winged helix domain, variant